jgi:signal transduction histidine kinase
LTDPPDFRRLFESAPGLYLVLAPDDRIVAVSNAYLHATMTHREDIIGRLLFDVFPDNPDDPQATGERNLRDSLERVKRSRTRDAMAVQKYDIRRPGSGEFEERFWSPVNSPVLDEAGTLTHIIHSVEDVTEFVRLKQHDARQAESFRARSVEMEAEIFRRAQMIQEVNRELRAAQDGLEQRVRERTAELADANAALRVEMKQSRNYQAQLGQAQKMKAVGTLAAGIAHDFNNLLTVISGYSNFLLDALPSGSPDQEMAAQIAGAADRAATLTRQLLAFSRQQVIEPKVLDLNAVVRKADGLLHRLIGEDVILSLALASDLGRVKADAGQLEQVIVNLVVNARDAMPRGGRLTLETADAELDSTAAQSHIEVVPGDYVMLAVTDTGVGMDEATKARLFEPFFTTKGPGKGTGLGLATVFGIVRSSGGHVWAYSEPGHGTTFKIYLPRVTEGQPEVSASPEAPAPGGRETILVVEDEATVRALTARSLRQYGYTVLEAADGPSALLLFEAQSRSIDLVISDVVMPRMGGRLVADAVQAIRPGMRFLYISGYTNDAVVRHGVLHEHVAYLQKPFTPDALARKVRLVLDG